MEREIATDVPSGGAEAGAADRRELAARLIDAEQRLARVPELELRIADLEYELAQARRAEAAARQEAMQLDQM
ncbi:MAG: hypothetical protein ACRDNJ_10080, partial [Solirubrobacteraceae bacterium]